MPSLILASQSPRRKEILNQLGIPFEIINPNIEEVIDYNLSFEEIPQNIAIQKSLAVQKIIKNREVIILAADTIVVCNNQIFGKPTNKEDATKMLEALSNNCHQVITGISIIDIQKNESWQFSEKTNVYFNKLSSAQIAYYIEKYKPYDKAGSYAIQEWIGMVGIHKIEGDYYNVIGLPIQKIYPYLIKNLG